MPRSRQNILLNFKLKIEALRANLNKNKKHLNCGHFGKRCIHVPVRDFILQLKKKLVGGPERGPPVIRTNPRGHKQPRFMEKGNGHATSDPRFSG